MLKSFFGILLLWVVKHNGLWCKLCSPLEATVCCGFGNALVNGLLVVREEGERLRDRHVLEALCINLRATPRLVARSACSSSPEGANRTHRVAQALMAVNALLPHRIGDAASSNGRVYPRRRSCFAERGRSLLMPPRIEVLRGSGRES